MTGNRIFSHKNRPCGAFLAAAWAVYIYLFFYKDRDLSLYIPIYFPACPPPLNCIVAGSASAVVEVPEGHMYGHLEIEYPGEAGAFSVSGELLLKRGRR